MKAGQLSSAGRAVRTRRLHGGLQAEPAELGGPVGASVGPLERLLTAGGAELTRPEVSLQAPVAFRRDVQAERLHPLS